jgi:hypothetical protein
MILRNVTIGWKSHQPPREAPAALRHLFPEDVQEHVSQREAILDREAAERAASTIAELAERYMREHALPKKQPSSIQRDESMLRVIIVPALGERRVADITRTDIARLHHSLLRGSYQAAARVELRDSRRCSWPRKRCTRRSSGGTLPVE